MSVSKCCVSMASNSENKLATASSAIRRSFISGKPHASVVTSKVVQSNTDGIKFFNSLHNVYRNGYTLLETIMFGRDMDNKLSSRKKAFRDDTGAEHMRIEWVPIQIKK